MKIFLEQLYAFNEKYVPNKNPYISRNNEFGIYQLTLRWAWAQCKARVPSSLVGVYPRGQKERNDWLRAAKEQGRVRLLLVCFSLKSLYHTFVIKGNSVELSKRTSLPAPHAMVSYNAGTPCACGGCGWWVEGRRHCVALWLCFGSGAPMAL